MDKMETDQLISNEEEKVNELLTEKDQPKIEGKTEEAEITQDLGNESIRKDNEKVDPNKDTEEQKKELVEEISEKSKAKSQFEKSKADNKLIKVDLKPEKSAEQIPVRRRSSARIKSIVEQRKRADEEAARKQKEAMIRARKTNSLKKLRPHPPPPQLQQSQQRKIVQLPQLISNISGSHVCETILSVVNLADVRTRIPSDATTADILNAVANSLDAGSTSLETKLFNNVQLNVSEITAADVEIQEEKVRMLQEQIARTT